MNLTMIAIIVIIFWMVALGVYITISRQQNDLQDEIESLQHRLGDDQSGGDN